MTTPDQSVKIYNAEEMLKTAKSVVIAKHQALIQKVMNDIMAAIAAEASDGKFAMEMVFQETDADVQNTIVVVLRELGYKVIYENSKALVSWSK